MQQYLQLFINGIQKKSHRPDKCFVAAFTSYNPEEGVSFVTESFAVELARRTGKRTLVADARQLSQLNIQHFNKISQHCFRTDVANLWSMPMYQDVSDDDLSSDMGLQEHGGYGVDVSYNNLQTLRFAFDYVLLDCPALSVSDEVTFLAPETDGVMIVVEADRTKREQIQNTQQTIEMANGNLLGFILNKREYIVPNWLYRHL